MNRTYTFRQTASLTKLLKILLGVGAALAVVSFLSSWLQIAGQVNDSRQQFIGLSHDVLCLVTVVVFSRWIYVANQNVRALGAQGLRFTPGWAVGYFFVPLFHLWRPYQAMNDLWRASKSPGAWQSVAPDSVLGRWWIFWIIANLLGWAALRASLTAYDSDSFQHATKMRMSSDVVYVALCISALTLVSQIHKSQMLQRAPHTALEL
jgi:hypothetical protein